MQAQARAKQRITAVDGVLVAFNLLETIRNDSTALLETLDPLRIPETHEDLEEKFQEYMKKVKESSYLLVLQTIRSPVRKGDSRPENIQDISKSATPRVVTHPDDAFSVLDSLSLATRKAAEEISRSEVENI